jgi:diphosphomevalonate decarboxylase
LTRKDSVEKIIGASKSPKKISGRAFAPSNIALCKYWGKRNVELNLPVNSSLSVSLGRLGTETFISQADQDQVWLNDDLVTLSAPFAQRLFRFLDLFRPADDFKFTIRTKNNIPTAAGLASSASGYAALVLALNEFGGWDLELRELSILARLGSGSASRSLFHGFVEWHRGEAVDGFDSYAEQIDVQWPDLRIAVLSVSQEKKAVGSTEGMNRTVETSALYKSWPQQAERDFKMIREAIADQDFSKLGAVAESNALAMHATMVAADPPLLYWLPETVELFRKIWDLRSDGLPVYFTIDAGPNVKVLFEEKHESSVRDFFPDAKIVIPFE